MEEFEGLDASEFLGEPLLERLSVDGSVVRVNLRSFKRLGLSLDRLFEAMLMSTERIRADKEEFAGFWKRFIGLVKDGKLDFDHERLIEFDEVVTVGGIRLFVILGSMWRSTSQLTEAP